MIHGKKALRENSIDDFNFNNQNASTMFTVDPLLQT